MLHHSIHSKNSSRLPFASSAHSERTLPHSRRSCDAQNGIAKILLFSFMQHSFEIFFSFFRFSLTVRKIIFQTTPFSTVFPPFFGRFSRESPAFWKPVSEFFAKTWDFSREIDTPSPTPPAPELVEGARGRGGRYGRTPPAMSRKRKWNEFIQSRKTTKTQLYFIYILTKKFTPIL